MRTNDRPSPTVRRIVLGQRLRLNREAAQLTVEAVAEHMKTSGRSVLRWEAGDANIRMRDLTTLVDLYGVSATSRLELETLAREARLPGWWTPYNSDLRPTFKTFLGLEAGATGFMEYSAVVIPGLLQTKGYMRAVLEAAVPMLDDSTIDARTEVRLKRQADVLARDMPTHFVIDEGCLRRRVGGVAVMREQLEHIREVARSRLVTVQVLPFGIGAHASILGGFIVLEFNEMTPVTCVELLGGDLYADGTDSVQYTQHFDKLREGALPEPHSLDLMDRIKEDLHDDQQ